MSHVSRSASRSPKSNEKRLVSLSQVKKKQTHASLLHEVKLREDPG
jgi:hypothetical protein